MAKLNPVLESTRFLVDEPEYVFINHDKLNEAAKKLAKEDLKLARWDAPVFLEDRDKITVDYFTIVNSINFSFNDVNGSKEKWYSVPYKGIPWSGAFGLWASFKRAHEESLKKENRERYPVLNAEYLSNLTRKDAEKIFRGQNEKGKEMEIPMLDERVQILNDIGEILLEKYDGHFHNLIVGNHRLYREDGTGIVQKLVSEFPSFDDSVEYEGRLVIFDKRAQLAPAMLYSKFNNTGYFHVSDVKEFTVFPDYVLPKGLRDMGILEFEDGFAGRVDVQVPLEENSREVLETRASTVHSCDILTSKINYEREASGNPNMITALNMDYRIWDEARKPENANNGHPHILVETIRF